MRAVYVIGLIGFSFAAGGCGQDGTAESAGERIDEVVENVEEGAQQIRDETSEAVNEAIDEVEQLTEPESSEGEPQEDDPGQQ